MGSGSKRLMVLEGRSVVVVDASLVRGTTSRSLVRFIKEVGAVHENGPSCDACFSGNYSAPLVDVERGLQSAEEGPGC